MTRRSWRTRYLRIGRLDSVPMRVRKFELRLVGAALVAGWVVAAGLVLVAYRPGGPLDVLVGLTMIVPIAHRRSPGSPGRR